MNDVIFSCFFLLWLSFFGRRRRKAVLLALVLFELFFFHEEWFDWNIFLLSLLSHERQNNERGKGRCVLTTSFVLIDCVGGRDRGSTRRAHHLSDDIYHHPPHHNRYIRVPGTWDSHFLRNVCKTCSSTIVGGCYWFYYVNSWRHVRPDLVRSLFSLFFRFQTPPSLLLPSIAREEVVEGGYPRTDQPNAWREWILVFFLVVVVFIFGGHIIGKKTWASQEWDCSY